MIEDYTVAQDTMRLENLFFTGLSNGTLAAGAFRVGTTAVDASDRIIYNDDTGDSVLRPGRHRRRRQGPVRRRSTPGWRCPTKSS